MLSRPELLDHYRKAARWIARSTELFPEYFSVLKTGIQWEATEFASRAAVFKYAYTFQICHLTNRFQFS